MNNLVRLTAKDARDIMTIKKDSFNKTLNIIRQMCDNAIKDACRRGFTNVTFEPPKTIFGREGYDPKAMGRALALQLYEDSYDVSGFTNKLLIKWDNDSNEISMSEPRQTSTAQMQNIMSQIAAITANATTTKSKSGKIEKRLNIS